MRPVRNSQACRATSGKDRQHQRFIQRARETARASSHRKAGSRTMAKNSIFTIIVATHAASMWPVKMAPPLALARPHIAPLATHSSSRRAAPLPALAQAS
jgi:hypothetical protein